MDYTSLKVSCYCLVSFLSFETTSPSVWSSSVGWATPFTKQTKNVTASAPNLSRWKWSIWETQEQRRTNVFSTLSNTTHRWTCWNMYMRMIPKCVERVVNPLYRVWISKEVTALSIPVTCFCCAKNINLLWPLSSAYLAHTCDGNDPHRVKNRLFLSSKNS